MTTDLACVCDYDEGPYAEHFEQKTRKANKPHKCCECHEAIQKGENYTWIKGLWEGEWWMFCVCLTCTAIRKDLAPTAPYEGLSECLEECLGVGLTKIPYQPGDEDD